MSKLENNFKEKLRFIIRRYPYMSSDEIANEFNRQFAPPGTRIVEHSNINSIIKGWKQLLLKQIEQEESETGDYQKAALMRNRIDQIFTKKGRGWKPPKPSKKPHQVKSFSSEEVAWKLETDKPELE